MHTFCSIDQGGSSTNCQNSGTNILSGTFNLWEQCTATYLNAIWVT